METKLEIFNPSLLTRDGISALTTQITTALDNGDFNPLDFKLAAKGFEKLIEGVKKKVDEAALTEAEKYTEKTFMYKGAQIERVDNLGTKYDYSNCNHPDYDTLLTEIEGLEKKKKEIEEFLKGIKGSLTVVDEGTGEVRTMYPPIKKSSSGIKITIK